jgi:hypothetical protein
MTPYIFNIGLNRAGTNSLTEALNILGIPSIHYMSEDGRQLLKLANDNTRDNKDVFDSLDVDYRGFSDFAGELFLDSLYTQYPNSKFILTNRNPEAWVKSKTFLWEVLKQETPVECTIDDYYHKVDIIRYFFKDKPDDIFLELNICEDGGSDTWNQLCSFLDKDVPDIEFPRLHESYKR